MNENKPRRLNEVLGPTAPQGANDARWFLVDHQLEQVKISAQTVVGALRTIAANPENEQERIEAQDCVMYFESMLNTIMGCRASFHSYLSGTDVPERISGKEL